LISSFIVSQFSLATGKIFGRLEVPGASAPSRERMTFMEWVIIVVVVVLVMVFFRGGC
jgi:hypothetical protein